LTNTRRLNTRQTILLAATLIISAAFIINLNNKYRRLSEKYELQTTELYHLQAMFTEVEEILHQLNITFTSLETSPAVKAANMIISQVGLEYFNQYFHDPMVEIAKYDLNTTIVTYKYDIEVGDYTVEKDVSFYFHPKYTQHYGIPIEGNLQPFTVTADEAINLAVDAGLPDGPYELEAYISYVGPGDVVPLTGDEEKYVWRVISWEDPSWANPRKRQSAHVNPHTGRVYKVRHGGKTYMEEYVDTLEEALAHGIDGYVKLDYPEFPRTINLTNTENITFTLQVSFKSYVENITEARVTVDPYNTDTYWIHSNTGDLLRKYLSYDPSGVIIVDAGETLNITCTLSLPPSEEGFSFNRRALRGLGIGAENMLLVHDLGG